jgi:hypothetical protein
MPIAVAIVAVHRVRHSDSCMFIHPCRYSQTSLGCHRWSSTKFWREARWRGNENYSQLPGVNPLLMYKLGESRGCRANEEPTNEV